MFLQIHRSAIIHIITQAHRKVNQKEMMHMGDKRVNDRTALQQIAVYAYVRVLSEAITQLPLHVYE